MPDIFGYEIVFASAPTLAICRQLLAIFLSGALLLTCLCHLFDFTMDRDVSTPHKGVDTSSCLCNILALASLLKSTPDRYNRHLLIFVNPRSSLSDIESTPRVAHFDPRSLGNLTAAFFFAARSCFRPALLYIALDDFLGYM